MGTRRYAAYYDSKKNNSSVIAIDDDGYWFNTGVTCSDIETAKSTAAAIEAAES